MTTYRAPHFFEPTLWATARWTTMAYVMPADRPPVMALVFQERDLASAVFTAWQHVLGQIDVHDLLRVAIIEGSLPGVPPGYSVHLGLDAGSVREAAKQAGDDDVDLGEADPGVWRRMPDSSGSHLRRFKDAYARHRRYLLVPATFDAGLELMPHLGIGKQRLALRRVGDVGLVGDPDAGLWTR